MRALLLIAAILLAVALVRATTEAAEDAEHLRTNEEEQEPWRHDRNEPKWRKDKDEQDDEVEHTHPHTHIHTHKHNHDNDEDGHKRKHDHDDDDNDEDRYRKMWRWKKPYAHRHQGRDKYAAYHGRYSPNHHARQPQCAQWVCVARIDADGEVHYGAAATAMTPYGYAGRPYGERCLKWVCVPPKPIKHKPYAPVVVNPYQAYGGARV